MAPVIMSIHHYAGWKPRLSIEQARAWFRLAVLIKKWTSGQGDRPLKLRPENIALIAMDILKFPKSSTSPSYLLIRLTEEEVNALVAAELVVNLPVFGTWAFGLTQAGALAMVPRELMLESFLRYEAFTDNGSESWICRLPFPRPGCELALAA